MTKIYQKDRIYSLIIGDKDNGWEIHDLNISFDVVKSSDNKAKVNNATIDIWNLSAEKQAFLEKDYVAAVLSVGYLQTGLKRLFAGQVTYATTRKEGPDVITQIKMGTAYTELNHKIISKFVAPGMTREDALKMIAKDIPVISRNVITGVNCKSQLLDGLPLSGSNREMLNEICRAGQMEWQVDEGVLYVADVGESHTLDKNTVYVINEMSGLIKRPYKASGDIRRSNTDKAKKKGLQFTMLCNPDIVAGSLIKLEYGEYTGYYKVDEVRSYGEYRDPNTWYSDVRLTEKIG